MKHFPLLFAFNDIVLGNGFVASVTVNGRVLASEEDEGWWMYGVQPGDLATGGKTFAEARLEFHKDYLTVLIDIAQETKDSRGFKEEIHKFFAGINAFVANEWQKALVEMRAGRIADALATDSLPVLPASSPSSVDVKVLELEAIKPQNNVSEPSYANAA